MDLPVTAKKQQADAPPTRVLAEFLAALRYEDLPAPVIAKSEELFLDWLASALA